MSDRSIPNRVPVIASLGMVALCIGAAAAVRGGNGPMPAPEQPLLSSLTQEYRRVAEAIHSSVVTIEAHNSARLGLRTLAPRGLAPGDEDALRRFFGAPFTPDRGRDDDSVRRFDPTPRTGSGSGWIWSADGLIVTNNHVVADAEKLVVRFSDGRELPAEVVGTDPATDIALLRVKAEHLRPAVVSDEEVQQGDIVFTFGAPFAITDSMSQGIVSGVGRQTGILGMGGYEAFIQTDAAINPGNSGGPLVDVHGRVVGMNTAILSSSGFFGGIGFAIPTAMIQPVVEQLAQSGTVQRGFLGVTIQGDPELVASFGADHGVVVGSVIPSGPGAAAGLQRGDVIQEIAGRRIETVEALRFTVAEHAPGSQIDVELLRNGKTRNVAVTLGRAPGSGAEADQVATPPAREAESMDSTRALRELGIERMSTAASLGEGGAGVRIEGLRAGSVLAQKGLQPGDVIAAVGGVEVHDVAGFARAIADHDLKQGVRISVRGQDDLERYVFVRLAD
ncbi:MAG: trypsin-like peptidase domain-containing protein [Planctomycetota bacterium]